MKYRQLILLALIGTSVFSSCDKNFTNIEDSGYDGIPEAISQADVRSDSLPGQIKLKWNLPKVPKYDYLQIKYYDPLTKKYIYHIASPYTDSLLVDSTRLRFGEYTFSFQTFNDKHEGSSITDVKALSGRAPAVVTISKTKVALNEGQLSTNDQEPSEGPIKNLIDNDPNTFFHTRWSSPQMDLPQYIQINFNEPHKDFVIYYQNRNGSQAGPREVQLQISNDGVNWETVKTISTGLPSGSKAEYMSDLIQPNYQFMFFRFNVTKTYGDVKYFNMAEFAFYDAKVTIYDPEIVDIN